LLGFCNYYRWFIPKYFEKAEPLTRPTKKDEPFVWGLQQQSAFEMMVTAFTTTLALQHYDYDREVIIATDASDDVSTGVLPQ
jgi:hypothetical protein